MPWKAKRPCRYSGCAELADVSTGYCERHLKLVQSQYNRFGRTPEAKKRYGYRWKKIRAAFLARQPLCEMCRQEGRYTDATEVHHVKPLAEGGTNDFENLMALCKPCHSRITAAASNSDLNGSKTR